MFKKVLSLLGLGETRPNGAPPSSGGRKPGAGKRIGSIAEAIAADPERWRRAREAATDPSRGGPKILLATNVPAFHHVSMLESSVAAALTLRGADVHLVLCDSFLPGCQRATVGNTPDIDTFADYRLSKTICGGCQSVGQSVFGALGLTTHKLGDLLSDADRAEAKRLAESVPLDDIRHYALDGVAAGEHAYAGCLRYFARGDIENVPGSEVVLRRYLEAALLTAFGYRTLVRREKFDGSCFHHGIYIPQGVVGEVLRAEGVPVVNWNPAYRANTFIFSHDNSYHHTMIDEDPSTWRDMPWTAEMETDIMAYLESRRQGTRDWIWFHEKPDEDYAVFSKSLGLDPDKPIIGLLTNVMWDAQLHFTANAFPGMLEWLLKSIAYFGERPDVQLLIRVHPAEIRGTTPSRQPIMDELAKAFPTMPSNVFVIPPESPVSTYAAMEHCDSVVIFGTKTGVELTSRGIPVIVGGEAWIRGKGLTRDASSPEDYFTLLDSLPTGRKMDDETTTLARRYAYHFFFRRMVPLPFIVPVEGKIYRLDLGGLQDLEPGAVPGLDVICDGVLNRKPFVYKAETLGIHDKPKRPDDTR